MHHAKVIHISFYVVKYQKSDIVGMRKQGLDDNRGRVNVILQLTPELSVGDGQNHQTSDGNRPIL